jgi:hypothetical protein
MSQETAIPEITEQELQATLETLQRTEGERAKIVVQQWAATLAHPTAAQFELRHRLRLAAFVKYASQRL